LTGPPRNPKLAAQGRAVRAALREILGRMRCETCGHTPPLKLIRSELPAEFADRCDGDIRHHLRLIERGVE
jgi:hypothetical protein